MAHNAAFDKSVLKECCEFYNIPFPDVPWICTYRDVAVKKWPKPILPNHQLKTVCRHHGIELNHHEALSDALAVAEIIFAAQREGWDFPVTKTKEIHRGKQPTKKKVTKKKDEKRYKIGEYEFREADYRGMLDLARQLELTAEELLEILSTSVEDGKILEIYFEFHNEMSRKNRRLQPQFPNLTDLTWSDNPLTDLDLSSVPNLTSLNCVTNELTALDLSPVPNLTYLEWRGNDLTSR